MAILACSPGATSCSRFRHRAKPRRSCVCWLRSSASATHSSPFCCNLDSTLARASDVALDCSVPNEACGLGLAPTASTTAMLALGDALAIAVSLRKGFRAEDFASLHPGGKLGKKLALVRDLDALRRRSARRRRRHANEPGDLRDVTQKARRHNGARYGGPPPRPHLRWRSPPPAGGPRPQRIYPRKPGDESPSAHHRSRRTGCRGLAIMEERRITSLVVTDKDGAPWASCTCMICGDWI